MTYAVSGVELIGEALGTAFLLAVVVGSGIMAERLAGGNEAIALLANSLATGAGLFAVIVALHPVSGAHLNPVVTLALAARRAFPGRKVLPYVVAQVLGACAGVMAAHAMFDLPLLAWSAKARPGMALGFSELVATGGLLLVILRCAGRRVEAVAAAVALYITSAYWFTASTSFANPAATAARALTDTFTGIRPGDVPMFLAGQGLALAFAAGLGLRFAHRGPDRESIARGSDVVHPHD